MLTSDEDVDVELQLLAEGADAFVSKAKDPRVLTMQVQRLLKGRVIQKAA
jgi:DNA-binding NarL/FixJ family response regulator